MYLSKGQYEGVAKEFPIKGKAADALARCLTYIGTEGSSFYSMFFEPMKAVNTMPSFQSPGRL
jgi:hypothetical protein